MTYEPQFTVTPALLRQIEAVAALRERIQSATVQVAWIPALDLIRPLMKAGLIKRMGTLKHGRYVLK
ncbi:MAG TPA: hypothetical protein VFT48_00135 [Pyrinomonadaceae bacterium]|nr:hypothetical protein [Pyrinomonadaceae bacterium]